MASLALNASTSITLPAGSTLFVYGTGVAVYGPGPQAGVQVGINNKGSVGPFSAYRVIYLTATGSALTYNTSASNTEEPVLRLSRSIAGDVQGVETLDNGQADGSAAMAAALGFNVPTGLVANDSTTATVAANDAAIQSALAKRGIVYIQPNLGVIWSKYQFAIYDDTQFIVGPGTRIKQVAGNGRHFLHNYWYQAAGSTPSGNITYAQWGTSSRENVCTIPFSSLPSWATDPNLNYIQIKWDTNGYYNGIFRVYAVDTVAKTVSFIYPRGSGGYTSAGTLYVAPANAGIVFDIQGVIDYNDDGSQEGNSSSQDAFGFLLNHIRATVRACTMEHVNKYCMCIGNSVDFEIQSFTGQSGSDGVHFLGYNQNPVVAGVRGIYGDDPIAYTWDEGAPYNFETPTANLDALWGMTIHLAHVDADPYARATYIGTTTSTVGGAAYDVKIYGYAIGANAGKKNQFATSLVTDNVGYAVVFDGIVVDNADLIGITGQVAAGVSFGTTVNRLSISGSRNVAFNCNNGSGTTTVKRLNISDTNIVFDTTSTSSTLISASNGATINKVSLKNVVVSATGTANAAYGVIGYIGPAGTINRLEMDACEMSGYGQVYDATLSAAPTIVVRGGNYGARTILGGQSATLILDSVELTAGYLISPAWGNSKTVNLYANNLKITGGSIANWGGTGNTVNLYNGDGTFAIDATSSGFTPKSGAVFYNTAAGYGAGIGLYAYGAASATRIAA